MSTFGPHGRCSLSILHGFYFHSRTRPASRYSTLAIQTTSIGLPLWAIFLPSLFLPLLIVARGPLRRYRRKQEGRCTSCGYDLTGNTTGHCPECGTKI